MGFNGVTYHNPECPPINKLAIKSPEKWQPAVAEKRAMYAGNGGPTRSDGYFLTLFMPKMMEMALPVPTKTILQQNPDTAMLFAPTHLPLSRLFCSCRAYISQGHCRKSHDEAESIVTKFGAMGSKGLRYHYTVGIPMVKALCTP